MSSRIVRGLFGFAFSCVVLGLTGFIGAGIGALFGPSLNAQPLNSVIIGSALLFALGMLMGLLAYLVLYIDGEKERRKRFPRD